MKQELGIVFPSVLAAYVVKETFSYTTYKLTLQQVLKCLTEIWPKD